MIRKAPGFNPLLLVVLCICLIVIVSARTRTMKRPEHSLKPAQIQQIVEGKFPVSQSATDYMVFSFLATNFGLQIREEKVVLLYGSSWSKDIPEDVLDQWNKYSDSAKASRMGVGANIFVLEETLELKGVSERQLQDFLDNFVSEKAPEFYHRLKLAST